MRHPSRWRFSFWATGKKSDKFCCRQMWCRVAPSTLLPAKMKKHTSPSITQRVAELRLRRSAAGLVRLEVWSHKDDVAAIRGYAARVAKKRAEGGK